jgi:hypothetical protein
MAVDQALLDEAMAALGGAVDIRELRPGGQKTVRLVELGGEQLVMKVIALESGAPDASRSTTTTSSRLRQTSWNWVNQPGGSLGWRSFLMVKTCPSNWGSRGTGRQRERWLSKSLKDWVPSTT